jgi:hypothetical protein
MSQDDVRQACAKLGLVIGQHHISKLELGVVKWPALRILPVLANVLGFEEVEDMFAKDDAAVPKGAKAA